MNEVFARPPFKALWTDLDPFDWITKQEGTTYREVDQRRTFSFELGGQTYFAKVHSGTPLRETLKNWTSLRQPIWDARTEVRALERLAHCGVGVPRVVAWGVRGKRVTTRRSFIITEDVGTQRTLADAAAEDLPLRVRRRAILELAAAVRTMHEAGINHRDCYLVHVLVRTLGPDSADLVLLDLHRAQIRDAVPLRWRAKDLGGLWFSAENAHLSRTDLLRFVRCYAGRSAADALREAPEVWRSAAARAKGLCRERARRGSAFGR